MKYFSRANEYRASNVVFKVGQKPLLQACEAWSYGWWQFVKMVNGKMVFNRYRYSSSTGKQQQKVLSLIDGQLDAYALRQKGISVEIPKGLQDLNWIEDGIQYAKRQIEYYEQKQKTGRVGTGEYKNRAMRIHYFKSQAKFLESVKEPVTA